MAKLNNKVVKKESNFEHIPFNSKIKYKNLEINILENNNVGLTINGETTIIDYSDILNLERILGKVRNDYHIFWVRNNPMSKCCYNLLQQLFPVKVIINFDDGDTGTYCLRFLSDISHYLNQFIDGNYCIDDTSMYKWVNGISKPSINRYKGILEGFSYLSDYISPRLISELTNYFDGKAPLDEHKKIIDPRYKNKIAKYKYNIKF